MISPCPHCLHTFRREYPTLGQEFAVESVHHSELLAELIRDGRIELAPADATDADGGDGGRRLTFHDPCYLGRYERVFDPPREILARTGLPVVELGRRRERSFCCGGGNAGFRSTREEEKRVDQERKREIKASGANVLVTACPECKMMLDATVEETMDLAELVARRMRRRPDRAEPGAAPNLDA